MLKVTGLAWLGSFAIAVVLGYALKAGGLVQTPLLVAVILSATSLGVIIPVLKDAGEIATPFGQLVVAAGTIADLGARRTAVAALFQATSLPFIVAATAIGLQLGLVGSAESAALVAAGLLSLLVFPLAGLTILRGGAEAPSALGDRDVAVGPDGQRAAPVEQLQQLVADDLAAPALEGADVRLR